MPYQKKLHFMHIPKAGGTSLSHFIEKQFNYDKVCPYIYLKRGPRWISAHEVLINVDDEFKKYQFFKGHLGWLPRTLFSPSDIETITFLREPEARSLSIYNYLKGNLSHKENIFAHWSTYEDFVYDKEYGLEVFANYQTKAFCAEYFFKNVFDNKPSTSFLEICDILMWTEISLSPQQMLELAIERLHQCAFVGLMENFNESFQRLCAQYGWLLPRQIPQENVSLKLQSDVNTHLKKHVVELNQLDNILYQEAKKIFHERTKTSVYLTRRESEQNIIQNTPITNRIKFTCAGKIMGEGWDTREGQPPALFCWSTSTSARLFFVVQSSTSMVVSFKVLHSAIKNLPSKLTLTANLCPVVLWTQHNTADCGIIFEGIIPKRVFHQKQSVELVFSIPELVKSKDDMRSLGFALQELTLIPRPSLLKRIKKRLLNNKLIVS